MIVYNHGRRWFAMQADAKAWRRQTANPKPVIKITVTGREDLVALLNALCEPGPDTQSKVPGLLIPEQVALVDRAFVPVETDIPDCVPRFLLDDAGKRDWDKRHGVAS